ncbi:TPA: hypothetical protein IAB95_03935 [Candidatus Ventrenecus avicola]|nr:hypothetical protein [Candidatus Ventrenecus avicola]
MDIQEKCQDLEQIKQDLQRQIEMLELDKTVQQYIALKKEKDELEREQSILYRKIKLKEYDSCRHIIVYSFRDRHKECIKCGLRDDVLEYYYDIDRPYYSADGIMFEYLKKNCFSGFDTDIVCAPELARAIYKRLRLVYPKISDEEILKYLQNALLHISTIPVNKERKQSRARRLSLNSNFSIWNSYHF